jgi:hypothetical protein
LYDVNLPPPFPGGGRNVPPGAVVPTSNMKKYVALLPSEYNETTASVF